MRASTVAFVKALFACLVKLRTRTLVATCALVCMICLPAQAAAQAAPGLGAELEQQVRQMALAGAAQPGARLEVQVGALDTRLHLAPCQRVEPYLPSGTRLWGKTRIGLRCLEGASRWNVFLPLTVKVYGHGLTLATALPAGAVRAAADLRQAEVDLAEEATAVLVNAAPVIGRTLARAMSPGQSLRQNDLKARVWFAAGDTVQIRAVGSGFAVGGEGQALGPGLEGQAARVRTESGRIVVGLPVSERQLEVSL